MRLSHADVNDAETTACMLRWYEAFRRPLPFRSNRAPYAIWIAEIMAQQTTMRAVVPYWQRFLATFPDIESLARADIDQVLALWSGLGYYRRARQLHRAAQTIVNELAGRFPETLEQLRTLPGVGPYTAAAIASICFGLPTPVVDGNVIRVLTRFAGIEGDPKRVRVRRQIEERARDLIDPTRPGEFNQALMELGALVCRRHNPRCDACPLAGGCRALAMGDPVRFPQTVPSRPSVALVTGYALIVDTNGAVLLHRIPPGEFNAGLWELPGAVLIRKQSADNDKRRESFSGRDISPSLAHALEKALATSLEIEARVGPLLLRARHTITHHRILGLICEAVLTSSLHPSSALEYFKLESLEAIALTSLTRRALREWTRRRSQEASATMRTRP